MPKHLVKLMKIMMIIGIAHFFTKAFALNSLQKTRSFSCNARVFLQNFRLIIILTKSAYFVCLNGKSDKRP